jgi:hypothetical protein
MNLPGYGKQFVTGVSFACHLQIIFSSEYFGDTLTK